MDISGAIFALVTACLSSTSDAAIVIPSSGTASSSSSSIYDTRQLQGSSPSFLYTGNVPFSSLQFEEPSTLQQISRFHDGQQQSSGAFEVKNDPDDQLGTSRLLTSDSLQNTVTSLLPTNTVATLLNGGLAASTFTLLAKADLYKNDGSTPTSSPTSPIVGSVLFFQKSGTSYLSAVLAVQTVDATASAITGGSTWVMDVRTNPMPSTTARCSSATLGPVFNSGTISTTGLAGTAVVTAATNLNIVSVVTSVPPATATLFGTNSIVGRSVRVALTATTDTGPNLFCGNIVSV